MWAHYRELPNDESAVSGSEKPPPWRGQTYNLLKGFTHLPLEDAVLEYPAGESSQAAVRVQTLDQNLLRFSESPSQRVWRLH